MPLLPHLHGILTPEMVINLNVYPFFVSPASLFLLLSSKPSIEQCLICNILYLILAILYFSSRSFRCLNFVLDLKPPTELVQKLIEMGFPRAQCDKAVEATKATNVDDAVSWIVNNKPVCKREEQKRKREKREKKKGKKGK